MGPTEEEDKKKIRKNIILFLRTTGCGENTRKSTTPAQRLQRFLYLPSFTQGSHLRRPLIFSTFQVEKIKFQVVYMCTQKVLV